MSNGSNVEETNQGPETTGSRSTQQQLEGAVMESGKLPSAVNFIAIPRREGNDVTNDAWER